MRANSVRCVEIVKRCHRDMASAMTGPGAIFWVFHVLRDYAHTLKIAGHRHVPRSRALAGAICEKLEAAQVPLPIVFGHHDLLPANFMDDGKRLWLIDWEYGAFGTAMFDLANMAANNSFGRTEEQVLLETYFEPPARRGAVAQLRCHEDGLGLARSRCGAWSRSSISMRRASTMWRMPKSIAAASKTCWRDIEFKYGKL